MLIHIYNDTGNEDSIVTSFNEKLYNYYAHRFLKTYNLPFNLHIYHEGATPEDFPLRDNIHYTNIHENSKAGKRANFIARVSEFNVDSVEKVVQIKLFTHKLSKRKIFFINKIYVK